MDKVSIEFTMQELKVIISGVTQLPLAMNNPLYTSAISVVGKIKESVKTPSVESPVKQK